MKLASLLSGKKTYLIALLGAVYGALIALGKVENRGEVWGLLGALGAAAARSAIANGRSGISNGRGSSAVPMILGAAVLVFCGGCATQFARQSNAETKDKTTYFGMSWFNKSALEGLSVGKKSKTTSEVFALEKGNAETQPEALKAMAEAIGVAAGTAAKTAVAP